MHVPWSVVLHVNQSVSECEIKIEKAKKSRMRKKYAHTHALNTMFHNWLCWQSAHIDLLAASHGRFIRSFAHSLRPFIQQVNLENLVCARSTNILPWDLSHLSIAIARYCCCCWRCCCFFYASHRSNVMFILHFISASTLLTCTSNWVQRWREDWVR